MSREGARLFQYWLSNSDDTCAGSAERNFTSEKIRSSMTYLDRDLVSCVVNYVIDGVLG